MTVARTEIQLPLKAKMNLSTYHILRRKHIWNSRSHLSFQSLGSRGRRSSWAQVKTSMNSIVNSKSVCIREKPHLKRQTTTKLKITVKNKTESE